MCKKSLRGIQVKTLGSKLSLPFLLGLLFFLVYSPFVESQAQQSPQTPPSDQYSKMTQDELLKLTKDKDCLLLDWLNWSEKEKALRKERDEASAEQLASRDKLIRDQAIALKAVTQERDDAKAELGRQQLMGWLERGLWGLGGLGLGYVTGDLTPKR